MKGLKRLLHPHDGPYFTEIINACLQELHQLGQQGQDHQDELPSDELPYEDAPERPQLSDSDGTELLVLLNQIWAEVDLGELSDGAVLCLYLGAERIMSRLMSERSQTIVRVVGSMIERLDIARFMSAYDDNDDDADTDGSDDSDTDSHDEDTSH